MTEADRKYSFSVTLADIKMIQRMAAYFYTHRQMTLPPHNDPDMLHADDLMKRASRREHQIMQDRIEADT